MEKLMNVKFKEMGIERMSLDDRLRLVEDIWDTIAQDSAGVPVPAWHRTELRRRLKLESATPPAGATWEQVKARIRRQRKKKTS